MTIPVVQIGTGNAGRLALRQLITDPRFDLVGVAVSSPGKVGLDAGELAGLGVRTGVVAGSLDDLLGLGAAAAVYCAMGDTRPIEATRDCRRLLEAGINVAGTAPGTLLYPWGTVPDRVIASVEESAQRGGASIWINGVDPGFVNDLVPLALASASRDVRQVRCIEIADYATYDGAEVMYQVMGFGTPLDQVPMLLLPGVLGLAWGPAIRQLGAGLGLPVDDITEAFEREPAPEAFDIAAGHVPHGSLAALRFEITGWSAGRPVVVVEHVTRLRGDLRPDWRRPAQPGGSYRVEITGEPSYGIDICPDSTEGDHNHAAIAGAVARVVNALPAVIAAPPGIRSTLDLPLVVAGAGGPRP